VEPAASRRATEVQEAPRPAGSAFPGQAVAVRKLNRKWAEVRLPKVGWVRFRWSRPLGGAVRNATMCRDGLGWHVSFGIATDTRPAASNGLPGCGVDFGVACSAYVSAETSPRLLPPTLTAGEQRRLLGLERRKARQLRWAKRYNRGRYSRRLRRTIAQIAMLRARQARRRLDFTHKLTTDLAKNHGWVGIEDLRVKGMTSSAKSTAMAPGRGVAAKAGLNRGILDNAPYERRRQLAYKAPQFGSELRVVPAPGTSQTCSACGHRDSQSRPGCGRVFACTARGHQAHADHNAARNIERIAAGQAVDSTRSHPRVARPHGAACVNPSGTVSHERPRGIPPSRVRREVNGVPGGSDPRSAPERPSSTTNDARCGWRRQAGPQHHPGRGRVAEGHAEGEGVVGGGPGRRPGAGDPVGDEQGGGPGRGAEEPPAANAGRGGRGGGSVAPGVGQWRVRHGQAPPRVTATGLPPIGIQARWHDRVTEAARRRTHGGRTRQDGRAGGGRERPGERRGAGGYARVRALRARAISRSASRLATVWRLS
jgi:putative transposase